MTNNAIQNDNVTAKAGLGVWSCTALVIGNMIGSGFFIAPAALAPYGTVAIIGWGVMAVGAVCLGLVFARLARIIPATGGPYAYTRMGFGKFAGFFVAWGYWISIWASLPAMAAALVGYLAVLIPPIGEYPGLGLGIGLASIWLVAGINLRGVKEAGLFVAVTTYTKLVPFIGISVFGLFWVDWGTFAVINPTDKPFLSALLATAPLTMFAFLGIESATVPAGDVIDPKRTIPRATLMGVLVTALVYILGTTVVIGVLPHEVLLNSHAPFADAARAIWGEWAAVIISLAAIISSLGALNGWTLLMGQVPAAAARDGAMPAVFGRISSRGVPSHALFISVVLATLLVLLQSSGTGALIAFYDLVVKLSTDAAMIPYVFCSVVEAILYVTRHPVSKALRVGAMTPPAVGAFVFSVGTVYGAGPEAGMWALLLMFIAVPVWIYLCRESADNSEAPGNSSAADQ
jgi:basic amino acid/polyamine antiporter, APA family